MSARRRGAVGIARALLGACALAAWLGGCAPVHRAGGAPPAATAAPVDAPPAAEVLTGAPPEVQRCIELNRSLGDVLRAAGARCADVARALDAWTAAHGAEFRRATDAMDAWEAQANHRRARRYHALMEADVTARVETGSRCDHDRAARAAFERFFSAVGFDGNP